jgi:hypothetical protein
MRRLIILEGSSTSISQEGKLGILGKEHLGLRLLRLQLLGRGRGSCWKQRH